MSNNIRWKKRLFVLNESTLYYYSSERDVEPKGVIVLKDADVQVCGMEETVKNGKKPPSELNNDYVSLVIKTPFRTYWLLNADRRIAEMWNEAISKVSKGVQIGTSGHSKKVGWLVKSGGKVKTWKQRFFVLRNDILYYYKPKPNEDNSNTSEQILNSTSMVDISTLDAKLQNMVAQGVVSLYNSVIRFKPNQNKKKKKSKNAEDLLQEIEDYDSRSSVSIGGRERGQSLSSIYSERMSAPLGRRPSCNATSSYIIPQQESFDTDFQKTYFSFEIQNHVRTYVMYAKTQDECDEWVSVVSESILNVMAELATFINVGQSTQEKFSDVDDVSSSSSSPRESDGERTLPSYESIGQRSTESDEAVVSEIPLPDQPVSLLSYTISEEINKRKMDEKTILSLKKSKKKDAATFQGSYSEKFVMMSGEQNMMAEFIPIKLRIFPGLFKERQTLVITQPIDIEGSDMDNCVIEFRSSKFCEPLIRVASENVRFKKVTFKLISELSNEQIEMRNTYTSRRGSETGKTKHAKDNRIPCVIAVESGSVLFDECKIIYEDHTDCDVFDDDDRQGDTCCIHVANNAQCVALACNIQNAHYGVTTSQTGTCVCMGGKVRSKLSPFLNLDEGSNSRNYNVAITSYKGNKR